MKSKKSSIKLGEKARDSSTNQSRNDHCSKAFALTQWRMQDWRLGGAEVIEMLICVKI